MTFISAGQIILSKPSTELLDNYGLVKCQEKEFNTFAPEDYLNYKKNRYDYEVLVENKKAFQKKYKVEVIDKITLEDLMILMIKGDK